MQTKRLKRLHKEKEENSVPHENFYVQPIDDNMLNWHFTILGVKGTPFEGGVYHGCFKLPNDYPMNPPDIYFHTANGRFMNKGKICLTITGYHKSSWTPAWSIRTMTQAVANYMIVKDRGIGSINESDAIKKQYAKDSKSFVCEFCGPTSEIEGLILRNNPKKVIEVKSETNVKKCELKTVKKKTDLLKVSANKSDVKVVKVKAKRVKNS